MSDYGNTESGGSTTFPAPGSTTSRSPAYPSLAQEAAQDAAATYPNPLDVVFINIGFAGKVSALSWDSLADTVSMQVLNPYQCEWAPVVDATTLTFPQPGVYQCWGEAWFVQPAPAGADANGVAGFQPYAAVSGSDYVELHLATRFHAGSLASTNAPLSFALPVFDDAAAIGVGPLGVLAGNPLAVQFAVPLDRPMPAVSVAANLWLQVQALRPVSSGAVLPSE